MARFIGPDPEAAAAEVDTFEEATNRIKVLKRKFTPMRNRGLDDYADELEAQIDALEARAEDLAR